MKPIITLKIIVYFVIKKRFKDGANEFDIYINIDIVNKDKNKR